MRNSSKPIRLLTGLLALTMLLSISLAGLAGAEEVNYSHSEYLDVVGQFFSVD